MKIKEIRQLTKSHKDIRSKVLAHVTHNQYEVRILLNGQEHSLTNWRDKPLIFRSLDQAFDALKKSGFTETVISQDNEPDKIIILETKETLSVMHTPLSA
ncbi:DUF6482 family protein [Oceanospirillum sediminis]|uniref:Uncharacterized protein n=1 Tax=Oceanospirillum sediminis TaxID=2760088 RepID=A0A839IM54_9GAMM|nr:DUF6482 family protein [Oceanospirillum sediminis]MBB1486038.1 hypothetical protein [Oceanospirillum sediminis]